MRIILILLIVLLPFSGISQANILENPDIQQKIESCLNNTYNYNFKAARSIHGEIENALPKHPVTDFIFALIIYWENMPLLPDDKQTDEFLSSMEKSISRAKDMLKEDPNNMEGVFFDLHARAFIAMFWADNGKFRKVIRDIDNLYRRKMQGSRMKQEFNEFYFSSGLYSYYIEAYLEAHPVYKPIAALFQKGDKEQGLQELQYAIDSATYIQIEAILFMSLIQLNYEKNMSEALEYASILYNNFPNNTYYTGHYLMILLYQEEYELASAILQGLEQKQDEYANMLHLIYDGFLFENKAKDPERAKRLYLKGIEQAEKYGPFADIYKAIAYAGLSRIHEDKGNRNLARRNRKRSKSLSNYEFILSF